MNGDLTDCFKIILPKNSGVLVTAQLAFVDLKYSSAQQPIIEYIGHYKGGKTSF